MALLLTLPLAGCGGADTRSLTPTEETALRRQLETVREAAAVGDAERARAALRAFRADVARLADDDALTVNEARALRAGALHAGARVPVEVVPPPAEVPPAAPAPRPEADDDEKGEDKERQKEDKERADEDEERGDD